jgi:hypothetical protein
MLRPPPVEVVVELREVLPPSRGNQAHDVIGQKRHQRGHDRQLRALLFEFSGSTILAAYGRTMTIRELFRHERRRDDVIESSHRFAGPPRRADEARRVAAVTS